MNDVYLTKSDQVEMYTLPDSCLLGGQSSLGCAVMAVYLYFKRESFIMASIYYEGCTKYINHNRTIAFYVVFG